MTNGKLIRKSRQLFKTHFQFFFFVNRGLSKNTVVKTAHSPSWQAEEVTICVAYCWYTIFTIIPLFSNAKILSLFFIQKNADYLGIFFLSLGKIGTQMLVPARPSALTSLLVIAHLKHNPSFLS